MSGRDNRYGILGFAFMLLFLDMLVLLSFLPGNTPLFAFSDFIKYAPRGIIILMGIGVLHFVAIGGSILVIREEIMKKKIEKIKTQDIKEEKNEKNS